MAQDSSDKPKDSVPENPPARKDESTSDGRDATPETPLPADINTLLDQAEGALTDLEKQVPNTSDSDMNQPVPSDSQATENPVDQKNPPPGQQPSIQQENIDQTLNNLEADVHSLNQLVGDSPPEQAEKPDPQNESLDSSGEEEKAAPAAADPDRTASPETESLPPAVIDEQEQTSDQTSTELIDDSQTDSQDADSAAEQLPVEDIDDVLASLADDIQDVTQDKPRTATDSTPPTDLAPPETSAEDEQAADDEINAVLNQTQQEMQDSSPQNSDESDADQSPSTQDSATAPPTDQTETSTDTPTQEQTDPTDTDSHEETAAEPQENQSAPVDEKVPAEEQPSTADQEPEEVITSQSKQSSASTEEIPVAAEAEPEKLAQDAAAEPTEEKDDCDPEQTVRFPLPQRLVVNTMAGINKPFGFVPEKVKDVLGIAALVTVLLSVITAALILFMLD